MEHPHYNTTNFPHRVGNHGNWDIYRNDKDYCASIPTAEAAAIGCQATHYGDMDHVRATLGEAWLEQQATGQLSKAPDVRTTFSRASDPTGEGFQVVAWLKASPAGGEFCPREEATHVRGQSLSARWPETNDCAVALEDIIVTGNLGRAYWSVREHAQALGQQRLSLSEVTLPRWD